jgi:outer membrane lipoprotein SlyB
MALDLQSIKAGNRRYLVNTADLEQKAQGGVGANKRTAETVGGGAVLGTLIGAIAGGGKGAAIGAEAGAGAGAGTQVLTRGKTVKVPAETTLRFKLDQPLTLQAAYWHDTSASNASTFWRRMVLLTQKNRVHCARQTPQRLDFLIAGDAVRNYLRQDSFLEKGFCPAHLAAGIPFVMIVSSQVR